MELIAGEPDYVVEHVSTVLCYNNLSPQFNRSTNLIVVLLSTLRKSTGTRGCILNMNA